MPGLSRIDRSDVHWEVLALCKYAGDLPASVARYGQSREKRSVGSELSGYELGEKPHALGLARLEHLSKMK
jgi:hypothetical protein